MHGGSQNPNESLNNLIWERAPKEVWVSRKVVEKATYQALAHFNDGFAATIQLLKLLGIRDLEYSKWWADKLNGERIVRSKSKHSDDNKCRRKALRAQRKGIFDKKSRAGRNHL
jgi:hypothetical protein